MRRVAAADAGGRGRDAACWHPEGGVVHGRITHPSSIGACPQEVLVDAEIPIHHPIEGVFP